MTKTETSLNRYSVNAGDDDEYPGSVRGCAVMADGHGDDYAAPAHPKGNRGHADDVRRACAHDYAACFRGYVRAHGARSGAARDRKNTRLNSSH